MSENHISRIICIIGNYGVAPLLHLHKENDYSNTVQLDKGTLLKTL